MSLVSHFFPAVLIVSLLFIRGAWAQSQPDAPKAQNIEAKSESNFLQPWQPSLNQDQETIGGPLQGERGQFSQGVIVPTINKPISKNNSKKMNGTRSVGAKSDSLGPSFGKYKKSVTKNMSPEPEAGSFGSLLSFRGSKLSDGYGSSFLDGYLLNSLQDKGRNKPIKEKQSR